MKTIKIKEILIEDRMRQHYDETRLQELTDSIGSIGLIHAPVLDKGKLVCGGRRLRAITLLQTVGGTLKYQGEEIPAGYVPYTELGSSTEEVLMAAELEENLRRANLTMAEEAAGIARLHGIRVHQNPTHTKQDTAIEVSRPGSVATTTDVRNALLINENLHNPEVAKAKTEKEALKIIRKQKEKEKRESLAEEFTRNRENGEAKSAAALYQRKAEDLLTELADGIIDVICTDPPYGIDAQTFNGQDGVSHDYDDTRENFESIINAIASQGYRVCKREAHAYLFLDFANWGFVRDAMERAGWNVWPRPIIWSKGIGLLPKPAHGPRYTHEYILFASKGDRRVTSVAADVINIRTLSRQRRGAEKPAALYADLLSRSVQPGDTVLDPCCGLGPIFPAANTLKCAAIGGDVSSEAIGYATTRLNLTVVEDEQRRAAEISAEGGDGADQHISLEGIFQ